MTLSTIDCPSAIVRVVVYARGATITRRASLPAELPTGPLRLCVSDLTAHALPGSLRAASSSARLLLGVEPSVRWPQAPQPQAPLKQRERALAYERDRLQDLAHAAKRHQERLRPPALDLATRPHALRRAPTARFEHALRADALLHELSCEQEAQAATLDADLKRVLRELAQVRLELEQADAQQRAAAVTPTRAAFIHVAPGEAPLRDLELSYDVEAARWWPAYTVRLEDRSTRGAFSLDAFVAQDTGEAWREVSLALCTADMARDVRLPELPSLRLGRQQPPKPRGYRPTPDDLDALFSAWEAARTPPAPPPPKHDRAVIGASLADLLGGGAPPQEQDLPAREEPPAPEMAKRRQSTTGSFGAPPSSGAPPLPGAPPARAGGPMPKEAKMELSRALVMAPQSLAPRKGGFLAGLTATGGGGARYDDADEEFDGGSDEGGAQAPRAPEALLPADAWLDFSSLVLRDPDKAPRKGRLERRKDELGVDLSAARRRVEQLPNPLYGCDPRDTRGMFDHRYDAAGLVDILSNAQPQRVSLQTAETGCTPVLRTVPRADARAYREVELLNPFQAPLLAGPVDVFVEGALLRTSDLAAVDRGGLMKFGLGLEERVRVARNARVEESTRGLLGGSTHLVHHVHIEATSNLNHPIRLTVLDRVPVTDDKEVEVKLLSCEPQAARYEQLDVGHPVRGGLRWVLELPHGQKRDLRFSYSVELSSKSELIGGNRRE